MQVPTLKSVYEDAEYLTTPYFAIRFIRQDWDSQQWDVRNKSLRPIRKRVTLNYNLSDRECHLSGVMVYWIEPLGSMFCLVCVRCYTYSTGSVILNQLGYYGTSQPYVSVWIKRGYCSFSVLSSFFMSHNVGSCQPNFTIT